ncbi:MAG TPA: mechanosensitive ion channel family protein [Gemmatimonadaceae bacterium]|nr:mechanosensitive ion channel family protein [Gemmatimonadaceae bacterium]
MTRALVRVLALIALLALPAGAQAPADTGRQELAPPVGAVVMLDGDSLFTLYGSSRTYTAQERAQRVSTSLARAASRGLLPSDTIGVIDEAGRTEITLAGQTLFFVADEDAAPLNTPRPKLAREYADVLRAALPAASEGRTSRALWLDALRAALLTAAAIALILIIRAVFPRIYAFIDRSRQRMTDALKNFGIQGITGDRAADVLLSFAHVLRGLLLFVVVIAYVPLLLRIFPQTADLAISVTASILTPIGRALRAIIDYLPNLVVIVVIVFVTRVTLRLVHGVFLAVERGTVTIRNFDPDWAIPTYQIVRPLLLALAFALAFPYLPGANSEAIKGVSLFIGALVSFGSTSAIANLMAGIVLLYSRAFHVGDWVRIGSVEGIVVTRTLLVTRVRTPKNVEISVPNSAVLSGAIENFTARAEAGELILHTEVTIGYDAPWRTVHELLIAAALATEHIEPQPAPFVLQTALNDFNVSYQINCCTRRADLQPAIYGELHQNIQEKFNAAGVEIMSPNYHALRDGNTVTIPAPQRPAGYKAPGFRVDRG